MFHRSHVIQTWAQNYPAKIVCIEIYEMSWLRPVIEIKHQSRIENTKKKKKWFYNKQKPYDHAPAHLSYHLQLSHLDVQVNTKVTKSCQFPEMNLRNQFNGLPGV